MTKKALTPNVTCIDHISDKINVVEGDLTDQSSLNSAMKEVQPDA